MKVYLDLCALKRPFDDQTQGRIWIESQAVLRILEAFNAGEFRLSNSAALVFENQRNPDGVRKQRTADLLATFDPAAAGTDRIFQRAAEIRRLGFRDLDALHIAFAESQGVDYFLTVDDDILDRSRGAQLAVKVVDVVAFVKDRNL